MITILKKYHFYAAHRNKGAGEKCGRIHGHTYNIVCHFGFNDKLDNNGVSCLFCDIDNLVEPIFKAMCHYLILCKNDTLCKVLGDAGESFIILPFETSCENLAKYFSNSSLPVKLSELFQFLRL